jgi:pimeloyl-ACP methyl ester carboxylesterase
MRVHSPFSDLLDAVPIRAEVATVLGSETHYWVYGPDDAAVTIVIAHGYRGEHHGLEPVIAQFEDVRFIGADMPGFGDSTPLTEVDHSIAGYAAWLGKFMEEIGLGNDTVVLGHSFGSIIAAYGLANGLFSTPQLVLINPIASPPSEGPNARITRATVLFYALSMRLPERLGRKLLDNWIIVRFMSVSLAKTRDKQLRRWIHDQHHRYFGKFADRRTVVDAFNASVSTTVGAYAAQITMPTLLIGADDDLMTTVPALHELQQKMPNAQLHIIPGVGHLIHYEKARVAAGYIVDFLGRGRLASGG